MPLALACTPMLVPTIRPDLESVGFTVFPFLLFGLAVCAGVDTLGQQLANLYILITRIFQASIRIGSKR